MAREKEADEQWAEKAEKINEGKQQSLVSLLEERGLIQSIVGLVLSVQNETSTPKQGADELQGARCSGPPNDTA